MKYNIGDKFNIRTNNKTIYNLILMPPQKKYFVLEWVDDLGYSRHSYESQTSLELDFILINKLKTILPLP